MDNTTQANKLKELQATINKALAQANELGATTKAQTLKRMIEVINFDLFKLGVK